MVNQPYLEIYIKYFHLETQARDVAEVREYLNPILTILYSCLSLTPLKFQLMILSLA
jgi:hypothetical protein